MIPCVLLYCFSLLFLSYIIKVLSYCDDITINQKNVKSIVFSSDCEYCDALKWSDPEYAENGIPTGNANLSKGGEDAFGGDKGWCVQEGEQKKCRQKIEVQVGPKVGKEVESRKHKKTKEDHAHRQRVGDLVEAISLPNGNVDQVIQENLLPNEKANQWILAIPLLSEQVYQIVQPYVLTVAVSTRKRVADRILSHIDNETVPSTSASTDVDYWTAHSESSHGKMTTANKRSSGKDVANQRVNKNYITTPPGASGAKEDANEDADDEMDEETKGDTTQETHTHNYENGKQETQEEQKWSEKKEKTKRGWFSTYWNYGSRKSKPSEPENVDKKEKNKKSNSFPVTNKRTNIKKDEDFKLHEQKCLVTEFPNRDLDVCENKNVENETSLDKEGTVQQIDGNYQTIQPTDYDKRQKEIKDEERIVPRGSFGSRTSLDNYYPVGEGINNTQEHLGGGDAEAGTHLDILSAQVLREGEAVEPSTSLQGSNENLVSIIGSNNMIFGRVDEGKNTVAKSKKRRKWKRRRGEVNVEHDEMKKENLGTQHDSSTNIYDAQNKQVEDVHLEDKLYDDYDDYDDDDDDYEEVEQVDEGEEEEEEEEQVGDIDDVINQYMDEVEQMQVSLGLSEKDDFSEMDDVTTSPFKGSKSDTWETDSYLSAQSSLSDSDDDMKEEKEEFGKRDRFLYKSTNVNVYERYKRDLKLYREMLKDDELDEFYKEIIRNRELIDINYKNEYALKMKYHKGYDFSLHNLHIVNEQQASEKFYSNFVETSDEEDHATFQDVNYFADLSKIDIDPIMFKEFYIRSSMCNGEYLPLKGTLVENICFLAHHLKKEPSVNKIPIKAKKSVLYRLFFHIVKKFNKLPIKQCIQNVEELKLLDILFLLNEEIVKESKNELNIGKCLNNLMARNHEWYDLIKFICMIMLAYTTYMKEHYFLTDQEREEFISTDHVVDLPIFEYLNSNVVDIFVPTNMQTQIDIDLLKDITNAPEDKKKIFQTWYVCYLFTHKVYLINKMWNVIKKWEASKFIPNPWYIDHVGSALVPEVINLHHLEEDKYAFFRYIDSLQLFVSFKRSKKYPLPNYDKNNFHLVENVVAFQGTASPFMWMINVIHELSSYPFLTKGKLHKAYLFLFKRIVRPYLRVLKKNILKEIKDDKSKYTKENPYVIIFTGHSFGAAMAHLSSFYLAKILNVKNNPKVKVVSVTYGMPMFYDDQFSEDFRNSGVISNNISIDYDPIPYIMAFPGIKDFKDPEEEKKSSIVFKVDDLKTLNHDFGENIFNGNELFHQERNQSRSLIHLLTRYIFNNVFIELGELHFSQTHYFFYYVFLTLLSGWANEAEWGTFFLVPFFLFDIINFTHSEIMTKSKEVYKKYREELVKKLQNSHKRRTNNSKK
ncbi:hypothetical protein AK88_00455 [Plasmodium fragile]|uniref:Fungal lipase-type domain-containing protein n=1 Tax=Plasmodium fragile TaxID=5857 RepID=A0A0D9QSH2_PLAFR|nr:uncharacterized protein AK88_00455 [Plasmodium fragile]KJP89747.1 hypothetical protein AK88_00455 [Plasmodium fragile]